ncbi:MAG: hypothetical protein ALECFALPRED_009574 [Alectoria fallacina]|uniref:Uncharacterized protein n=1 Tax=Alectoria fallacina TaxID=1903189 RepID=A0A8H3J7H3_9LECA|nr:MAG: hypothetical protein ALECFALPRED_009574 [Alectoria fallacina]
MNQFPLPPFNAPSTSPTFPFPTNNTGDTNNEARPEGTQARVNEIAEVKAALFSSAPKAEVYRRIINTYRFRVEDSYIYGGKEIGWTTDYRGKPPRAEFGSFLYQIQQTGLVPDWFDREACAETMKLAKDANGDVYIGHAIDAEDIEAAHEVEGQSVVALMRRAAECVYGGGFEYESDPEVVGAVMAHRIPKFRRKGIARLPRKPGQERRPVYDPSRHAASGTTLRMNYYMDDYENVEDQMSIEEYVTLMDEHKLRSILDLVGPSSGTHHGYGSGSGTFHGGDLDGQEWEHNY